ncbi:hypothetical protein, partial [Selenomonas sp.]|uniref:hypothetical protein n=1 Tax=Selenomonas sp. TaxID=2053611 RepID=UPI003FA1ED95
GVNAGKSGSTANAGGYYRPSNAGAGTMGASGSSRVNRTGQGTPAVGAVDRSLAAAAGTGSASAAQRGAKVGANAANGSTGADVNAGTKAGSRSAVDQGLANALGRSGSAGYYNGKGFSQTSDDEEEEIKKKAKASA